MCSIPTILKKIYNLRIFGNRDITENRGTIVFLFWTWFHIILAILDPLNPEFAWPRSDDIH